MSENILQPRPRRVFHLSPSNESSEPSTPAEPNNPDLLTPKDAGSTSVSRNGSIMNLTSPTLYGIYSPTAFESSRDDISPWGTEAPPTRENPNPQRKPQVSESMVRQMTRSRLSHGLFRGVILPLTLKSALLFGFGITYGIITIHLHENHWITPVKLENTHFYGSLEYLGFWGVAGVVLGNILPWLDSFSNKASVQDTKGSLNNEDNEERTRSWVAAVRGVGAFVGIAFAMRRTHWESTTQASATLALANPVLWYLIDRTKTGFVLATVVGLAGMGIALGLFPELVPTSTSPASTTPLAFNSSLWDYQLSTEITQEGIAVRTWLASVLYCACLCFGNIGRQLGIGASSRR
ncbi:hypothetical protein FE257_004386 [Aspergillus nanangensis]|uniref:Uncharacterized protein n=1 Tax=Aspergillus nanangensis TaxID=2582783 RepID=A0AAD4GMC9_ASPNN|nr:hypothetical protein FE257_004386 [Aspergillus nanangensis]